MLQIKLVLEIIKELTLKGVWDLKIDAATIYFQIFFYIIMIRSEKYTSKYLNKNKY